VERFGRLVRHFPVAVSAGAMAGAWARQEEAPAGSTVVVDREISPLGRMGVMWEVPPASTLAFAMVLRPPLAPEDADVAWLVAALGVIGGVEATTGRALSASWPDNVVDTETGEVVAVTKVESQLGPGEVRAAVVIVRLDMDRLALGADRRDEVLEAVVRATDQPAAELADGPETAAAAYDRRCIQLGRRVKLRLLPKGETRGTVKRIDRGGRLQIESATGMVERISVDMLRELQMV
jgi:biotin-(acetyl-CoA carboxylase) ligase